MFLMTCVTFWSSKEEISSNFAVFCKKLGKILKETVKVILAKSNVTKSFIGNSSKAHSQNLFAFLWQFNKFLSF
jgi:hypothetical protein